MGKLLLNRISQKIFAGIFTGTLVVFSAYIAANYFFTKKTLVRLTNNIVERTLRSAYNQVESQVLPIINNAQTSVFFLSKTNVDSSLIKNYLRTENNRFTQIYGSGIIYKNHESGNELNFYIPDKPYQKNEVPSSPEICRNCLMSDLTKSGPYSVTIHYDTISLHYFYSDTSKSIYLLFDFPINYFINTLNREGRYLKSRHYLFNNRYESILSTTEKYDTVLSEEQRKVEINFIKDHIKRNEFGYFPPVKRKSRQALFISKLRGTDLILATVIQTDEVIRQLRRFYLAAFSLTIISLALLAYLLQRTVIRRTRPLIELSEISRQIEKGKIHIPIPEYHNDAETEQLAKTLRRVQERMQNYVSNLNVTLKEKRALVHDISIAEKIQNDMLPSSDWSLTGFSGIDIYCKMIPAKGVAGDFYDYFLINDEHLFFVLGDVSGKGVPAALFMVKTITLLQVEAKKYSDPGKVFTEVNKHLTFRNDEGMFVTGIAGIINIKTGETLLCDAGHHSPITNTGISSHVFKYHELNKNMPLGILIGGKAYNTTTLNLKKGDTIILFSDGFPEARNLKGEMLGNPAMEEFLSDSIDEDIDVIANKLWNFYENYTVNTTGNDDVSLFMLKYNGG